MQRPVYARIVTICNITNPGQTVSRWLGTLTVRWSQFANDSLHGWAAAENPLHSLRLRHYGSMGRFCAGGARSP